MVELFGVYALLLAGWGLWRARVAAAAESQDESPAPPLPAAHERGAAARRHLSTLP